MLTTITLVGHDNILVLFTGSNFHVAFTGVGLAICATDFFAFAVGYDHILGLYNAVCRANTEPRLAHTLTFTDWVEFTTYVGTSTWKAKKQIKLIIGLVPTEFDSVVFTVYTIFICLYYAVSTIQWLSWSMLFLFVSTMQIVGQRHRAPVGPHPDFYRLSRIHILCWHIHLEGKIINQINYRTVTNKVLFGDFHSIDYFHIL